MTHYVPCDLSVDTVTLNWYGIYDLNTDGWKYEPGKEKVTYVKMNVDKALEMLEQHIVRGHVLAKYTLNSTSL